VNRFCRICAALGLAACIATGSPGHFEEPIEIHANVDVTVTSPPASGSTATTVELAQARWNATGAPIIAWNQSGHKVLSG
jgi:hypothetical protein